MTTTHPSRSIRRGRRWGAVAAASVLALAPLGLTACGGGDDAASGASASGGAQVSNEDMQAFQECLAEHGVEMGAPPSGDGSDQGTPPEMPDQDTMAEAQEACGDLAPEGMGSGGPGMGSGGPGGEEMLAYTDCLAENGVEVAGPGTGGEPPSGEPPSDDADGAAPPSGGSMFGLDESDPEVAAALEACADLAPEMPSGAPGGSGDAATSSAEDGAEAS